MTYDNTSLDAITDVPATIVVHEETIFVANESGPRSQIIWRNDVCTIICVNTLQERLKRRFCR